MDHNKTSKEVTPVAPAQPPPAQVLAQVLAQPLAQPPPAQSWARASAAPPADKSRWRDVFVYATIALVAVAVGVGLNLHLDVEAWLAAAVAAPTALALLQAHQLQASGRQIDGLRRDLADLRRMTAQTMRVQREAMPAAGQRIAGNGMANGGSAIVHATATNAAGPGPGLQPRSQQAQPQRPQARGAPIGPAATAQTMPAHSIQPPAPRQAPLQPPQQTPGGGAAVSAATGHAAVAPDGGKNALPPPLPPSPATPVALTPAALTTSPRAASSPVPSPVSVESSAATTPTSPVAIPIDTTQDGVLQVAAPQIASRVSEALMGTYWGHRPGVSQETAAPAASHPASAATGLSLGPAPAVASPGSASPGTSARAVSLVPDLAEGPGERELETMQNLIQQLAQQLNAPRGDSIPATPPVPAASALDLAQSVAALRSTATTMRHEADLMAEKPGIGALPPVNPRLAAALRTDARATADGDAEIKQAKEPKADPAADVLHPETGPEGRLPFDSMTGADVAFPNRAPWRLAPVRCEP